VRVGFGYDSHRLVEGRDLVLCGVRIPFPLGLEGWSDADVAIHALIDALCGAASIGDIGTLFPPDDPAYRGISSTVMLEQVVAKLSSQHIGIGNVDITIVIEEPRLSPHSNSMRSSLASAIGIPVERVSVKAKTNDGMGFIGRAEGAAAFAVVTLSDG